MTVFTNKGKQKHYSGHAISINVDHQEFVSQLPKAMNNLGFIVVKRRGDNPQLKDLRIRKKVVMNALHYLKKENKLYEHVKIDFTTWESMPVDGQIPWEHIQVIDEEEEPEE